KQQLGEHMMFVTKRTLKETEVILFVVNATEKKGPDIDYILNMIKDTKTPVIIVINKIDLIHPDELPEIIERYSNEFEFADVVPISALQGENTTNLLDVIESHLEEGP